LHFGGDSIFVLLIAPLFPWCLDLIQLENYFSMAEYLPRLVSASNTIYFAPVFVSDLAVVAIKDDTL
jgi:hypothetical protein